MSITERQTIVCTPSYSEYEVGPFKVTVENDTLIAWDTRDNKLLRKETDITFDELDSILTSLEELADESEDYHED